MKKEITLDELLSELKTAITNEKKAEKMRVNSEFKKRKWHTQYLIINDKLHAKEYTIA